MMPLPALIHCTSPVPMTPRLPRLSPCSTSPASTYVIVSMPRPSEAQSQTDQHAPRVEESKVEESKRTSGLGHLSTFRPLTLRRRLRDRDSTHQRRLFELKRPR